MRAALGDRSQSWLARELGVSDPTVCNWIQDKRTPSLPMIRRIAEALQIRDRSLVRAWMAHAEKTA